MPKTAAKNSPAPSSPPGKAAKPPRARRATGKGDDTPAMRQYREQKADIGDALLLFRMGDFYETFYDDAKTIARVLGLTLTSRNKHSDKPIPMAGVPFHAADSYIARLVRAGYKVAVSDQMEDASQAKGIVRREVTRVITPGTLTDESLLDERRENYLVALCPEGRDWEAGRVGLACVELASGQFFAEMLSPADVEDELARIRPAELLAPEQVIDADNAFLERLAAAQSLPVSPRPGHVFVAHHAKRQLCTHFSVRSVEGFGFDGFDASLCAAAALLDYLRETQKTALGHVLKITPRRSADCVQIDQVTLRSLEVERTIRDGAREGSLLDAVDTTVNPMGARRLRAWLCYPLREPDAIRTRQQAIGDLISQPDRLRQVRDLVRDMADIERILARLGVQRATPRDMVGLGQALDRCKQLAAAVGPAVQHGGDSKIDLLGDIARDLTGHDDIAEFLGSALREDCPATVREGGFIADGHHAELDRLRNVGKAGHRWLAEYQAREAERTGIGSLKVGFNSVFGYYIEITHQHRDKVPPEYVRKQTVRNAERYITDELKRHEDEVLGASDRAIQLELQLFEEILKKTTDEMSRLRTAAEAVATLDVIAGLAELARTRGYCRPELVTPDTDNPGELLEINDGRHPVLDVNLAERFVPNDCHLAPDADRLLIITGPNMAGKSTYIRQVALLTLLAQTGSFVPAKSMRWSPVDRIFARVGASDELARGHSTFMVEMVETARILNNATPQSLVVLDEIGRGTSTYDGLSLAWAITEHIIDRLGCRTLFATHYHELTELADQFAGVANYNVAVREQLRTQRSGRDVVFLYKIVPGPADRSYGVHVAEMAGLPPSVVRRSEQVLEELERDRSAHRAKVAEATAHGPADDQLLLFDGPALPAWWQELIDRLESVSIDHTTPLAALDLLHQLQAVAQRREQDPRARE